jgi:hypothetical protein
MRRWLLDLHLYLGLLCLPYVVVFGISSILMNHRIDFETKREWQAQVAPLGTRMKDFEAAGVWDALDRRGRILWYTVTVGDAAEIGFQAVWPGRSYQVTAERGGRVSVVERNFGFLGTVKALHGLSDRNNSRWVLGWTLYTELTVMALVVSIGSGATLALWRADGRSRALWAGGLGVVASAALIAGIW